MEDPRNAALNKARAATRGERLDPLAKAKAKPASLRAAITAKCYDCAGGGQDPNTRRAVRECPVTGCPLWPVRPYQRKGAATD